MTDQPTEDEIRRVREWEQAQKTQQKEDRRRREEERRAERRAQIEALFLDRRIDDCTVEPDSYCSTNEVESISFVFDNGANVTLSHDLLNESATVEVSYVKRQE